MHAERKKNMQTSDEDQKKEDKEIQKHTKDLGKGDKRQRERES